MFIISKIILVLAVALKRKTVSYKNRSMRHSELTIKHGIDYLDQLTCKEKSRNIDITVNPINSSNVALSMMNV